MPTISELVSQHSKVPGDIRVTQSSWMKTSWFRPFFPIEDEQRWRGIDDDHPDQTHIESPNYQLYIEPKPKVMRAQYLVVEAINHHVPRPYTTDKWYIDDRDFSSDNPSIVLARRLTELEFDR